ncbi:MAG: hypothetical protein WDN23_04705 [Edaphobacter sp.]
MTPLVPDVNLYSGSARLAGNPWNPGALVKRIIQMGTDTEEAASALWSLLFGALSVDSEDDAWARWLQEEFSRRKLATINMTWQQVPWKQDSTDIATSDKSSLRFSNGDKDWVESARSMFIESIASADAADEADGLRLASWNTISRVWSLKNSEDHHARSLALALGYPPPTDNVSLSDHNLKLSGSLRSSWKMDSLWQSISSKKKQRVMMKRLRSTRFFRSFSLVAPRRRR